jgi:hypothetical protein
LINPVDFTRLYRDQKARQTDTAPDGGGQQAQDGNGQQA